MEGFGEIRSLLSQKPGRKHWTALCALLDALPEHARDEVVLTYCKGHFTDPSSPWGRWSHRKAPSAWCEPLRSGESFPTVLSLVTHMDMWVYESNINACAALLASTPHMGLLRSLALGSSGFTTAHAVQFAGSSNLGALRALRLTGGFMGPEGAEALARSEHLKGLEKLELEDCGLDDRAVEALAREGAFPALRWLNLRRNDGITDAGAAAIEGATHLPASARTGWR